MSTDMTIKHTQQRGLLKNPPKAAPAWTLAETIENYIAYQEAEDASRHTIAHHRQSWGLFSEYLEEVHGITLVTSVEASHINAFYSTVRKKPPLAAEAASDPSARFQRGHKATTVAGCGIDLRAIFNWLKDQTVAGQKVLPRSPMAGAAKPKRSDEILPPYKPEEITKLVAACAGSHPLRVRDKALLLMFLDTGLRREGMHGLRLRDVDLERGTVSYVAKGGERMSSCFSPLTRKALQTYLRLDSMRDKEAGDPLWWGKLGPLSYDGVHSVVHDVGERAGVDGSCHKLRRTAAISMLRSGVSLEDVRDFLGHADYQCIRKYLKYIDDDLVKAHAKYSPVGALVGQESKKGIGKRARRVSAGIAPKVRGF